MIPASISQSISPTVSVQAGESGDLVPRLLSATQPLFERVVAHDFFAQLERGVLPLAALCEFLMGKYRLFSGTFERGLIRARRARDPEVRAAWTQWILSEAGHDDMLLVTVDLLGGDSKAARARLPSYEAEALDAHCWRTAVCGSTAENLGVAFLSSERIYERTWGRIASALQTAYDVPPQAIDIFAEHEAADADHFETGLRLMRQVLETDATESYDIVEQTTSMALLCHLRLLDSVTPGKGWRQSGSPGSPRP